MGSFLLNYSQMSEEFRVRIPPPPFWGYGEGTGGHHTPSSLLLHLLGWWFGFFIFFLLLEPAAAKLDLELSVTLI